MLSYCASAGLQSRECCLIARPQACIPGNAVLLRVRRLANRRNGVLRRVRSLANRRNGVFRRVRSLANRRNDSQRTVRNGHWRVGHPASPKQATQVEQPVSFGQKTVGRVRCAPENLAHMHCHRAHRNPTWAARVGYGARICHRRPVGHLCNRPVTPQGTGFMRDNACPSPLGRQSCANRLSCRFVRQSMPEDGV
jgi:hypothetical protein